MLKFFIAGIIQGSRPDGIHHQDYRDRLKHILKAAFPDDEVFCPFENHPESIDYGDEQASRVFFELMAAAAQADVLVAYVPEASMGTAIEMWQGYQSGRVVVAISRLHKNWVVKFLAHHVCTDLDAFEAFVADGGLRRLIDERRASP